MKVRELIKHLEAQEDNDRVMVINRETGELSELCSIEAEHHEDGDGSTTVWITIEDY